MKSIFVSLFWWRRLLGVTFWIGIYILWGYVGRIFHSLSEMKRREFGVRLTSWISRRVLSAMGYTIEIQSSDAVFFPLTSKSELILAREAMKGTAGHCVISNHLSYIDVLAIASVLPSVFVTSREIQTTPFLGMMSTLGGSLFVERRSRTSIEGDIEQLRRNLEYGFRVLFFPEGTAGDGSDVLPFKKSLLESAVRLQRPVLPICINYFLPRKKTPEREPLNRALAECVYYYGDMTFGPHFLKVLGTPRLHIRIDILPERDTLGRDRKSLADETFVEIKSRFVPVISGGS